MAIWHASSAGGFRCRRNGILGEDFINLAPREQHAARPRLCRVLYTEREAEWWMPSCIHVQCQLRFSQASIFTPALRIAGNAAGDAPSSPARAGRCARWHDTPQARQKLWSLSWPSCSTVRPGARKASAEFGTDSRPFSRSVVAGALSHHGILRGQQRVVYCT